MTALPVRTLAWAVLASSSLAALARVETAADKLQRRTVRSMLLE